MLLAMLLLMMMMLLLMMLMVLRLVVMMAPGAGPMVKRPHPKEIPLLLGRRQQVRHVSQMSRLVRDSLYQRKSTCLAWYDGDGDFKI